MLLSLSAQCGMCVPCVLQTGYLSMDQARSLLPLEATDSNVSVLILGGTDAGSSS
jgi:hypothetical protein